MFISCIVFLQNTSLSWWKQDPGKLTLGFEDFKNVVFVFNYLVLLILVFSVGASSDKSNSAAFKAFIESLFNFGYSKSPVSTFFMEAI